MKTIRKSRIEQYHASVNSVKLSPGLDFSFYWEVYCEMIQD